MLNATMMLIMVQIAVIIFLCFLLGMGYADSILFYA
jgi:hypothetical protein